MASAPRVLNTSCNLFITGIRASILGQISSVLNLYKSIVSKTKPVFGDSAVEENTTHLMNNDPKIYRLRL